MLWYSLVFFCVRWLWCWCYSFKVSIDLLVFDLVLCFFINCQLYDERETRVLGGFSSFSSSSYLFFILITLLFLSFSSPQQPKSSITLRLGNVTLHRSQFWFFVLLSYCPFYFLCWMGRLYYNLKLCYLIKNSNLQCQCRWSCSGNISINTNLTLFFLTFVTRLRT